MEAYKKEQERLLAEAAQREKDLKEKLEAALAEIERKNKSLKEAQEAIKELEDKFQKECQAKANITNQYNILLETRYIVDRTTVETVKEERLSDIEKQLFRGI